MSGDNCLLQCLYSRTAITSAEALLHGKCPDLACDGKLRTKLLFFSSLVHVQTFTFA